MSEDALVRDLARDFRGCIDQHGQPTMKYVPAIQVERFWCGLTDTEQVELF